MGDTTFVPGARPTLAVATASAPASVDTEAWRALPATTLPAGGAPQRSAGAAAGVGDTDDEADVVTRAVAGDQEAFATLFDRYFGMVHRRLQAHVSDRGEAEDLAQEVFARAWRALSMYRQYGVPFRSWLFTIAHNLTIDWYRRRGRVTRLVQQVTVQQRVEHRESGDGIADKVCNKLLLHGAMARLKPEYREVLALKFMGGLDYAEMAEILGKRDSNIRTLVYRALKQLRTTVAVAA